MMQPRDESLAAREGEHRQVGHGAVYAREARAYLLSPPGSTAPTAFPVSFTAPTPASTANPTPVAATPTTAPATVTTAQPESVAARTQAQM
ncbi:MAG: hypothetical protein JWP43_1581, partial [Ramlibacter sp.]|nr:hypothetical protein [Ramlibacter sp.]